MMTLFAQPVKHLSEFDLFIQQRAVLLSPAGGACWNTFQTGNVSIFGSAQVG